MTFSQSNLNKQWKPLAAYLIGCIWRPCTRSTNIGQHMSFKFCWTEIFGLISIPPKEYNKNVSRSEVARISRLKELKIKCFRELNVSYEYRQGARNCVTEWQARWQDCTWILLNGIFDVQCICSVTIILSAESVEFSKLTITPTQLRQLRFIISCSK